MAVVFHHAVLSIAAFGETPPAWAQKTFEYGYLGVDFFFVLSGFIIHYTMSMAPRPAIEFAYDRFTRIMLPYWPIGIALAVAYMALPGMSGGELHWGWVSTLTLFPTEFSPALSVAWTLQHELTFYFVYAAFFFSRRVLFGMAAWTVAIVLTNLFVDLQTPFLRTLFSLINIEFFAGVLAAHLFITGRQTNRFVLIGLFMAFIAGFIALGGERTHSWLIGFSIAAILPWLCTEEKSGRYSVPEWLVFGGAISYAIYLVHNPLLSIASRIIGRTGIDWISSLGILALLSIGAGAIYYLVWEKPVMRAAKRKKHFRHGNTGYSPRPTP